MVPSCYRHEPKKRVDWLSSIAAFLCPPDSLSFVTRARRTPLSKWCGLSERRGGDTKSPQKLGQLSPLLVSPGARLGIVSVHATVNIVVSRGTESNVVELWTARGGSAIATHHLHYIQLYYPSVAQWDTVITFVAKVRF